MQIQRGRVGIVPMKHHLDVQHAVQAWNYKAGDQDIAPRFLARFHAKSVLRHKRLTRSDRYRHQALVVKHGPGGIPAEDDTHGGGREQRGLPVPPGASREFIDLHQNKCKYYVINPTVSDTHGDLRGVIFLRFSYHSKPAHSASFVERWTSTRIHVSSTSAITVLFTKVPSHHERV